MHFAVDDAFAWAQQYLDTETVDRHFGHKIASMISDMHIKQLSIWVKESKDEWTRMRKATGYKSDREALNDALNWNYGLLAHFNHMTQQQSALCAALQELKQELVWA